MSWLQRGARAWGYVVEMATLLFCTSQIMAGSCGVRENNKDHIPRSVPFLSHSLHLGWVAGSSPADPVLCCCHSPHLTTPLRCDPRMWFWKVANTALGCGSEQAAKLCGTEPSRLVQSSSRTDPELSLNPSLVPWSSGAAQHRWSHFQGFVCHCFPLSRLGDGESHLWGAPTTLSFYYWPHRTKWKRQTPFVHKAPSFIFVCFCY